MKKLKTASRANVRLMPLHQQIATGNALKVPKNTVKK